MGLTCEEHNSPADYIIEIASGDYGDEAIVKLSREAQTKDMQHLVTSDTQMLSQLMNRISHPFFKQMPILFERTQIILYKDPLLSIARLLASPFVALTLIALYGTQVGIPSGCLPKELEVYATPVPQLMKKFENELYSIMQNVSLLFTGLMVGMISSLTPILLNFPLEMNTFTKEYHNGWYSCISFYAAKMFSDLPLQVLHSKRIKILLTS